MNRASADGETKDNNAPAPRPPSVSKPSMEKGRRTQDLSYQSYNLARPILLDEGMYTGIFIKQWLVFSMILNPEQY